MMGKASNILSERELRKQYEKESGRMAIVGADRFGRGGKPSLGYFAWLEDTVRVWYPELAAMQRRENTRTILREKERKMQINLFVDGTSV